MVPNDHWFLTIKRLSFCLLNKSLERGNLNSIVRVRNMYAGHAHACEHTCGCTQVCSLQAVNWEKRPFSIGKKCFKLDCWCIAIIMEKDEQICLWMQVLMPGKMNLYRSEFSILGKVEH